MKKKQKRGMMYGSLAADSLALGSHWVYNVKAIEKRLGTPDRLTDPIVKTFHPTKKQGEFTHYGDQVFLLLRFIGETGGYDGSAFFQKWKEMMATYDGYFDHATRDTLELGAASSSDDLAGAARSAPLIYLFANDEEMAVDAVIGNAALTHRNPVVFDTARFFTRLVFRLTEDSEIEMRSAILTVLDGGQWESDIFRGAVEKGLDSADRDTVEAIGEFGQMCEAPRAIPSTVHLLARYPDDYKSAMIANTAAGGDSAARGLLAGMVLGAKNGEDAVPGEWKSGLVKKAEIETTLEGIDRTV